jgi:hypothetical protein
MLPGFEQGPAGSSFAQQRLIGLALVLGMVLYIVAVAVMQQVGDGKLPAVGPIAILDTLVPIVGAAVAVGAFLLRRSLRGRAETKTGLMRSAARLQALLVPLALLEAGCLLATTAWWLNGAPVPHLATALVLLALAIAIVPLQDPDAGR